jgi:hypothetical protein
MFDLSEILAVQGPDSDGNVLPAGLQEGSAEIVGIEADNQNILVALDAGIYNVRKATCYQQCTTCNGTTSYWVASSPFTVGVGSAASEQLQAQWNTGTEYDYTSGANWGSSSPSVATVPSPGQVQGVAAGTVTVSAYISSVPIYANTCNPYAACPIYGGGGGSAPGNVPPQVTFSPLTAVTVGGSVPVLVTFSGGATSSPVPITLSITTSSGTGSAGFAGGGSTMTITSPTTVTVSGITASSTPNNILLNATISSGEGGSAQEDATNPQTFSVVSTAIPVNFTTYSEKNLSNGTMQFSYTWQSSSGRINDIASCIVGEDVSYTGPNPYPWPAPMVGPSTNPTILNVQGNNNTGLPNSAGMADYQIAPSSYAKPYQQNSFQATQIFQWACPNYNDGAFYRFTPNITITRSVVKNSSGQWIYQVTKFGFTSTYTNSAPLP